MDIQTIFDQMGKSIPLEIGFDRRLSGSREGVSLTSPIPNQIVLNEPVPPMTTISDFSEVLTKSSIPNVNNMGILGNRFIITTDKSNQDENDESSEAEKKTCDGPGQLCPNEINDKLYKILTTDPIEISCACATWEFYPLTNPREGIIKWKSDMEFIHRSSEQDEFMSDQVYELAYSRWSPKSGNTNAPKLLLLHDALDSRKSWWCAQKMLSPFVDVISIDILGSGDSTKPRGLNIPSRDGKTAVNFPWSFETHAEYLIGVANVFWPGEKYFVAGTGWGAQIAAFMASKSENVLGIVMINPPGFSKDIHPELQYSDLYHLAKFVSDQDLESMPVSFIGRVRDCVISEFGSSDLGHSGRDAASMATLKLILDQYKSLDRQRVLIDQLVSISNKQYQEFPKTDQNKHGLSVESILANVVIVSGGNDNLYPPEHRNLYPFIYYASTVSTRYVENMGHLAHIEKPKVIAEIILDAIRTKLGFIGLQDAFIGFLGSSQGNERGLVNDFRSFYEF
jgi:pimeloyl-ACP methyl ester carboxylesterase